MARREARRQEGWNTDCRTRGGGRSVIAVAGGAGLGFQPLDVFDLWQRHLGKSLRWLGAHADQASELMEAVVRLLSGEEGRLLKTRVWRSLEGCGCFGRYVPEAASAEVEAELRAAAGKGFEPWLRARLSAATETEINVQLGEMTLKRHAMQLLDRAVSRHPDFLTVFGRQNTRTRHQCAEVSRSERRRWLRLLGTRHDVQIWAPDERPTPAPRAAVLGGALSPWVSELLESLRKEVPALAGLEMAVVDVAETHALLGCAAADGTRKEVVVLREPPALHVYNVVEHGRRWQRSLEYSSDASHCYAEIDGVELGLTPRPHWQMGDAGVAAPPAASLVIVRALTEGQRETFVPGRHLRGLLPEALLVAYVFWQRPDGSMLAQKRPEDREPADPMAFGDAPEGGKDDDELGSDTLEVKLSSGNAVVRRVPLDRAGAPQPKAARRLLSTLYARRGGALARLVELLERVEDLAHVLVWSATDEESKKDDDGLPVDLVELPRLRLSFDAKRDADGVVRLHSREHPGLFVGWLRNEAHAAALLKGLPHCLLLQNELGEAYVLLSALAKPCRLADPTDPLMTQLLVTRHAPGWADSLPGVRHYLYPVHRSGAFLTPPSLAARLSLLLCRWLARDFESVFELSTCTAVDTKLSAEEAQLWALLADFEDDVEPGAHACRLRLWLATRCCAELACPWVPSAELLLYLSKLPHVAPTCQLSASEELTLLRLHAGGNAQLSARIAFLDAALEADAAAAHAAAAAHGAATNPWGAAPLAAARPAPPLKAQYPARPAFKDFDAPFEYASLLDATKMAAWKKTIEALSYTRPEEKSGLDALKLATEWTNSGIRLDSDGKGFWLIYELLNGSLNFKLLVDDSPYALGALLLRLTTNHDHDLLPLLRLMETERELAVDMPKYEDGRSKTMKFFKGRTGKGMPEKVYDKLQSRLPQLRCSQPPTPPPPYEPPTQLPMPPLRELRRQHRSWLAPRTLDNALKARALPAPFNQQLDGGEALMLAPINPRSFVVVAPAAAGGGGGGGGGEKLGVEQHPAAASLVARKMQKRLDDDKAWLTANTAMIPRLQGFDGGGSDAAPSTSELAAQEKTARAVASALEGLLTRDNAVLDEALPRVLAKAAEGGASVSEATRRARALAHHGGAEPRVSLPRLAELLMSVDAIDEMRALNPTLTDAEASEVLEEVSALLHDQPRRVRRARARARAAAPPRPRRRPRREPRRGARRAHRGEGARPLRPAGGDAALPARPRRRDGEGQRGRLEADARPALPRLRVLREHRPPAAAGRAARQARRRRARGALALPPDDHGRGEDDGRRAARRAPARRRLAARDLGGARAAPLVLALGAPRLLRRRRAAQARVDLRLRPAVGGDGGAGREGAHRHRGARGDGDDAVGGEGLPAQAARAPPPPRHRPVPEEGGGAHVADARADAGEAHHAARVPVRQGVAPRAGGARRPNLRRVAARRRRHRRGRRRPPPAALRAQLAARRQAPARLRADALGAAVAPPRRPRLARQQRRAVQPGGGAGGRPAAGARRRLDRREGGGDRRAAPRRRRGGRRGEARAAHAALCAAVGGVVPREAAADPRRVARALRAQARPPRAHRRADRCRLLERRARRRTRRCRTSSPTRT